MIMKIKIEKSKIGFRKIIYRADFIELPGSPIVGTGKTEADAVATLFIRNRENFDRLNWDYLEINNKMIMTDFFNKIKLLTIIKYWVSN